MTVGSDPYAMRRLAVRFDQEAAQLEGEVATLRSQADDASWVGSDASAFQERLDGVHARAVGSTVRELRQAADRLRHQAARQEQASAD